MLNMFLQLLLFTAKGIIIVLLILLLLLGLIVILSRGKVKGKSQGHITIKNINQKYAEAKEIFLNEMLPKKAFKRYLKETEKAKKTAAEKPAEKNIFVINFEGDIRASAVSALREEVTAILSVAKKEDEVVVRLESAGGMVNAYGLAAAQLARFKEQSIPLTVIVDKVAASGGYLMATIANKIIAAPFAIVGSIGVIVQLPNFHRLLKEKNIDFEQLTAGNFKRTLTLFGENTEAARDKLHEEIEEIHRLFKNLIAEHRPLVDIEKVATGEHWLAKQALEFNLVDELNTSDDYLFLQSKNATIYEVCYHIKKSVGERIFSFMSLLKAHSVMAI